MKLLLDITQLGIKIGLTAQNVILDLASYAAFFPILADMMRSNSESEHKSFRSLANWQTKRKQAKAGVIVTSQVPRWLEVRDGKIHVLEERAQLVRRIFDMYVQGYGRGVIVRTLRKEGVSAWNTRKPVWHESYVNKLLCNRAVVGEYVAEFKTEDGGMGQEVITGYYPEVIDPRDVRPACRTWRSFAKSHSVAARAKNLRISSRNWLVARSAVGRWAITTPQWTRLGKMASDLGRTISPATPLTPGTDGSNRRYFNYLYLENFILSGTIDDLDIVAAVGIHDAELKQQANRVAALEAKLDHVAVSIQKLLALLKNNKIEDMEEIGAQLEELQEERRMLRAQLAQTRAEATAARQAAEDTMQFRERSGADALSPDTGMPGYVDMSDEAVYARRARIAMQLRSVVESITCGPDHMVNIVMKTGTTYELIGKDWICTRQGPQTPSGKPAVARFFVGRATWQLGQGEEPTPTDDDGGTSSDARHSPLRSQGQAVPRCSRYKAPERFRSRGT